MKLLDRLMSIQDVQDMSDREFAARLGISHTTWCDTKRGLVPIRYEILAGAVRELAAEYPALRNDVIEYLAASNRRRPVPSSTPTRLQTPSSTAR